MVKKKPDNKSLVTDAIHKVIIPNLKTINLCTSREEANAIYICTMAFRTDITIKKGLESHLIKL